MIRRKLTRDWLVSQKISVSEYDVYHETEKYGLRQLHPTVSISNKKFGNPVKYLVIGWYNRYEHKGYVFPYHRLLYAWYNNEVPEGYDVDHIDDNTFNNNLDNLQLLTHKDNMDKRKGNGHNQYNCKEVK